MSTQGLNRADTGPHNVASYQATYALPCTTLGLRIENDSLIGIDFLAPNLPLIAPQSPLAREVLAQLRAYTRNPDFPFDLPLTISGTAYQKRVWQGLCAIPRGKTLSYGELAQQLASGPRAIGRACGDNRLPIIIPCHRVIAKKGPGGFMHQTSAGPLAIKAWLLAHEARSRA